MRALAAVFAYARGLGSPLGYLPLVGQYRVSTAYARANDHPDRAR